MSLFEGIKFCGEFREYQSRVLQSADKYLSDGKINIVAAPGSGKTVLGLELIRRIGSRTLIFSPTTAIREQWGERLFELFLGKGADFESIFSSSLRDIKLVTSVTYQALFSAMEKVCVDDDSDSFPDVDIVREIRERGIGTICLDEAHHLKNEWQRALEKLLSIVGSEVKIISLTATPPYDSETGEWERYLSMCGEVDEEIFVPELVASETLCPHQDYIYFNYPTAAEVQVLHSYRDAAAAALSEISELEFLRELALSVNAEEDYDKLYSNAKEYIALLGLFRRFGYEVSLRLIRRLCTRAGLPIFNMTHASVALRFLIDSELLSEDKKDTLVAILKKYSLYNKRRVELDMNERLRRALISSVGKLDSISRIAKSESESLGGALRMLVLTDYIKRDSLSNIASEKEFSDVSVVSIFETLRRTDESWNIGVLSGSLVILPDCIRLDGIKHTREHIDGTRYSVVKLSGSLHDAVNTVGRLFSEGEINILVGTKSLLGEGWDAPCINSLIMASFVGSFVLSNQMRGRAIRIDRNDPEKSANIWHLVTVEPPHIISEKFTERAEAYFSQDSDRMISCDFDTLRRRFDSFMGPNYDKGVIESGIDRLTAIKPPFDAAGFDRINSEMLLRSKDRAAMRSAWQSEVLGGKFSVVMETPIEEEKRVPVFTFYNILPLLLLMILEVTMIREMILTLSAAAESLGLMLLPMLLILAASSCIILRILRKLFFHLTPSRSIRSLGKAVYEAMRECDIISSSARVEAAGTDMQGFISIYLKNASIHDQNIFNTAMAEMLSPIENPRYILVKRLKLGKLKKYNFEASFACPTVIGKKKEYTEALARAMAKTGERYVPVYTRTEEGRAMILQCRRHSYITKTKKAIDKKYRVRRWD